MQNDPPMLTIKKFVREENWWVLREFNCRDWYRVLGYVAHLKSLKEPFDLNFDEFIRISRNFTPTFISSRVAQIIEKSDQNEKKRLYNFELPAILVKLDVPDKIIRNEFEKALAEARKRFPAKVHRRGPNPDDAEFGELHFDTWINERVVPLGTVLAWNEYRQITDQETRYSQNKIGELFGFNSKKTALAKQKLNSAIDALEELYNQVITLYPDDQDLYR